MRQRATYCITGSPTSSVNRAAKAERDIASSRASMATVQGRSGSLWIRAIARPICRSCSALSHPVRAPGSVSSQERIACTTRMSARRVITASLPGRSSPASAAISLSVLCIQSSCGEPDASTWIVSGRTSTRLRAAGWSKRTAPQISMGGSAAAAVAQDLVAVADELALEVEDRWCWRVRVAAKDVPFAVRHEREVAGPEGRGTAVGRLEQDAAVRDHVEPEVPRHRHQRQAPWRAQLGAAVEGAVHPQVLQRLGERIGRSPGVDRVHWIEYARASQQASRLVDVRA